MMSFIYQRLWPRWRLIKRHEGKAEGTSRQVQEYIAFAASLDPKKYWAGVRHERWITNR